MTLGKTHGRLDAFYWDDQPKIGSVTFTFTLSEPEEPDKPWYIIRSGERT